jgi:hypothetical protein
VHILGGKAYVQSSNTKEEKNGCATTGRAHRCQKTRAQVLGKKDFPAKLIEGRLGKKVHAFFYEFIHPLRLASFRE